MRNALGTLLLALAACGPSEPSTPSALLLTIDTIRPDALGCYGGPAGVSPRLDALAEESCLFLDARTTAPITAPAHASMLTGLYPLRHGVRENGGQPLPGSAETLAERAGAAGFQTAAFVAARVLSRSTGLDQGFEVYDQPERPALIGHHYARRPAGEVVDAALGWLSERDEERPFFLWLHFFDPHQPDAPEPRFLQQAGGNPYHGEVAGMDFAIGRLLERMRSEELMDETAIVVVGDHGEAFGAHGEDTHGAYCYDATLRVPLLLRRPDGERAGERSDELVSVVDVFPTLLAAMELAPEARYELDGTSLWSGRVDPGRGIYVESYYGYTQYGWSPLAGWVTGGRKYLHSSRPELYDLAGDPSERRSVIAGADTAPFRRGIEQVAARTRLDSELTGGEDRLAELAALGYATGGSGAYELPHPLADTGLPSPRESAAEQGLIDRASSLAQTGPHDEAIRLYQEIRALNPRNPTALQELSFLLINANRCEEAVPVLLERLALSPERGLTHAKLASCLEVMGRPAEAIEHLQRALELAPGHVRMHEHIIRLLAQAGRREEAARYAENLRRSQAAAR